MQLQALLALVFLSASVCDAQMPRFVANEATHSIFLKTRDNWHVGQPNRIKLLQMETFDVIVNVGGRCSVKRYFLLCKCPGSTVFVKSQLLESQVGVLHLCKTENFPFTLTELKGDYSQFTLKMHKATLSHSEVFKKKLELKLEVTCQEATLQSKSLFVWNFAPLANVGIEGKSKFLEKPNPRFFTMAALEFSALLNGNYATDFSSIDFIDPSILSAIQGAPDVLSSKLSIGISVADGTPMCNYVGTNEVINAGKHVFFGRDITPQTPKDKINSVMHLDMQTGKLHYTSGLRKIAAQFISDLQAKQSVICAAFRLQSDTAFFFLSLEMAKRYNNSKMNIEAPPSETAPECRLPTSASSKSVSIISDADTTILQCPIICTNKDEPHFFKHGERILRPTGKDWTEVGGVKISSNGRMLEFPERVQKSHAGSYSCHAGGISFTFVVSVTSMPSFSKQMLPNRIFALENSSMNYSCMVDFTNVNSVTLDPSFHVPNRDMWEKKTLSEFNQYITEGQRDSESVSSQLAEQQDAKSLQLTVKVAQPHVWDEATMTWKKNFTHRFVCSAAVSAEDARKLAMASYGVWSSSDVFFVPRPTNKSIGMFSSCSKTQDTCFTAEPSVFEAQLQPQQMQYLRSIGVRVGASFIVDGIGIENKAVLNSERNSAFNATTGKLRLVVPAVEDDAILKELQQLRQLQPVFTFSYQPGSRRPQHSKPKDSVFCKEADCFYTTEYDENVLGSFQFKLRFEKSPIVAGASINLGLIVGIILAALLLLLVLLLLVFILMRDPGQTYLLDEKERQQGNHPEQEAKDEQFKEYQRPEGEPLRANRISLNSDITAGSGDDHELEEYKDDIDYRKFGEDGSFIGDYSQRDGKMGADRQGRAA